MPHRPISLKDLINPRTELKSPAIVQTVMATDIMVRAIAVIPIFLDLLSLCLRYLHAYQSPKGARKKLIM
jgi:hypothetical protein